MMIPCPYLMIPANGEPIIVTYSMNSVDTNKLPVNTVATFNCTSGYALSGDTTRTCGCDGNWSGSDPVCQRESLYKNINFSLLHMHVYLIIRCLL